MARTRRMQCKDVPDRPILAFLDSLDGKWGAWYPDWENSVMQAMPLGTPEKVAIAKMSRLIERGLVDGCGCGCRGDYELTPKGKAMLAEVPARG